MLIAIGNSDNAALADQAKRLLGDASPLVRGAAVWALSQLLDAGALAALSASRDAETDEDVLTEWRYALGDA